MEPVEGRLLGTFSKEFVFSISSYFLKCVVAVLYKVAVVFFDSIFYDIIEVEAHYSSLSGVYN